MQKENAIIIPQFYGDNADDFLMQLLPLLKCIIALKNPF